MNERYRWDEKEGRTRPVGADVSANDDKDPSEKAAENQPDLTDKEYYGVGGKPLTPNHAWEGREPYPQDVGGINHPGEEPLGFDPLTGDRGSAEIEPMQPSLQFGDQAVEQPDGGVSAGEATARPRSDLHYAEGGFVPRGVAPDTAEKRSWLDKAKDEVGALLGDQAAEERRKADHRESEQAASHGGDWEGHDDDTGWRDPVSPGKEAEVDHATKPKGDDAREEPREHRPGQFRE